MALWVSAILLSIALVGFLRMRSELKELQRKSELALQFKDKLEAYVESQGSDLASYEWLTRKSSILQSHMGPYGKASYKPPAAQHMFKNYPIIPNALSDLREEIERRSSLAYNFYKILAETIERYLGGLEDAHLEARREIKNPLRWLFRGIGTIALLPLYILEWADLLSKSAVDRYSRSIFHKSISFILSMATLISSLITIVDGWEGFIRFLVDVTSQLLQ